MDRFLRAGIISLCLMNFLFVLIRNRANVHLTHEEEVVHTYVNGDFPRYLPISGSFQTSAVAARFEESSRFKSSPNTSQTWWLNEPPDYGYVRLGPQRRIFAVSMFHQHHCLAEISSLLASQHAPPEDSDKSSIPYQDYLRGLGHIQHCMNYLRQNILCAADTEIEWGDFTERNYEIERASEDVKICKDWTMVYDAIEANYNAWITFKNSTELL